MNRNAGAGNGRLGRGASWRLLSELESLAEKHREVVRDQRLELVAGAEAAIGQPIRLDAAEHCSEPRITVRGWRLHVDELRHPTGVEVLVF
jgi:hypothetical protein